MCIFIPETTVLVSYHTDSKQTWHFPSGPAVIGGPNLDNQDSVENSSRFFFCRRLCIHVSYYFWTIVVLKHLHDRLDLYTAGANDGLKRESPLYYGEWKETETETGGSMGRRCRKSFKTPDGQTDALPSACYTPKGQIYVFPLSKGPDKSLLFRINNSWKQTISFCR